MLLLQPARELRRSARTTKLFQATQVADEARHTLGPAAISCYPSISGSPARSIRWGGNVKEIFDTLLGTSSWYLKTICLQLVCRYLRRLALPDAGRVVQGRVAARGLPAHPADEARHMGFASAGRCRRWSHRPPTPSIREMEDFAVWALSRTLAGTFPLAVYQEIGMSKAELDE